MGGKGNIGLSSNDIEQAAVIRIPLQHGESKPTSRGTMTTPRLEHVIVVAGNSARLSSAT